MSETGRENVEIIRKLYQAFAKRDVTTIFSLISPSIVIEQSTEIPYGGKYSGHDQAAAFFTKLGQAITSVVTIEQLIDAGDHVAVTGRTKGTINATGAAFDVAIAHVWQLQDGLAVRGNFYIHNPAMLAAFASR